MNEDLILTKILFENFRVSFVAPIQAKINKKEAPMENKSVPRVKMLNPPAKRPAKKAMPVATAPPIRPASTA